MFVSLEQRSGGVVTLFNKGYNLICDMWWELLHNSGRWEDSVRGAVQEAVSRRISVDCGCYCEKSKNGCAFLLQKQACDWKSSSNAKREETRQQKNKEAKEHYYDYAHGWRCTGTFRQLVISSELCLWFHWSGFSPKDEELVLLIFILQLYSSLYLIHIYRMHIQIHTFVLLW